MIENVLREIGGEQYFAQIEPGTYDEDRIMKVHDGDAEAGQFIANEASFLQTGTWYTIYAEFDDNEIVELLIDKQ